MEILSYIDPSAGSTVLQALVGVLAGVAFAVSGQWGRFKAAVVRVYRRAREARPRRDSH